jgi:hypothetical protein
MAGHCMTLVVIQLAGLLIVKPIPDFVSLQLVDTNVLIYPAARSQRIKTFPPDA